MLLTGLNFSHTVYFLRKNIEINVIDDEEYEKKEIFYVVLGEPVVVKNEDDDSGAGTDMSYDAEKERLEELGKPRLGTIRHIYHVLYNIETQLGHKNQGVLKQQFTFCLFSEVHSLFLRPIFFCFDYLCQWRELYRGILVI